MAARRPNMLDAADAGCPGQDPLRWWLEEVEERDLRGERRASARRWTGTAVGRSGWRAMAADARDGC